MSAVRAGRSIRSTADAWLATRMTFWALVLPVLKHVVALPRLASFMWSDGRGVPDSREVDRVVRFSWAAARLRPLPKRDNCLERSLIAYRYLSALNASPSLVLGMRLDEHTDHGHAWVRLAGGPIAAEDVSHFTPVLELGPHGRPVSHR